MGRLGGEFYPARKGPSARGGRGRKETRTGVYQTLQKKIEGGGS